MIPKFLSKILMTLFCAIALALLVPSCKKETKPLIKEDLTLSEKVITVGPDGGTVTVDIEAFVPYSIDPAIAYDWISFEQPDSLYNGPIEFHVEPNTHENGRIAYLIFNSKSYRLGTLEIRQDQTGSDGRYEREFSILESYWVTVDAKELLQRYDPYSWASLFSEEYESGEFRIDRDADKAYEYIETGSEFVETNDAYTYSKIIKKEDLDEGGNFNISLEVPFEEAFNFEPQPMKFIDSMDLTHYFTIGLSMPTALNFTCKVQCTLPDGMVEAGSGGNVISFTNRSISFRGKEMLENIDVDLNSNGIVENSFSVLVNMDINVWPSYTSNGREYDDSYEFNFTMQTRSRVGLVDCVLDVPETYTFPKNIEYKLTYPSSVTSEEANPILYDLLYSLSLTDGGYDLLFDRSLSGKFIAYKDDVPIKEMPFGELHGQTPIILSKSYEAKKSYRINFTDRGLYQSENANENTKKIRLEGFRELLIGLPDKFVLTDITQTKIGTDQIVTFQPGNIASYSRSIYPGFTSPLAFADGFVATRTLVIDLYSSFFNKIGGLPKNFDLVLELENTFPLNVEIKEDCAYFVSWAEGQRDKRYPIGNDAMLLKSVPEHGIPEKYTLTLHIEDFFFGSSAMKINVPLVFMADETCEGRRFFDGMHVNINKFSIIY